MRSVLLGLFQIFSPSEEVAAADAGEVRDVCAWLSSKKHALFLNADEILFTKDYLKVVYGGSETYIDWGEIEFFYYPFVGINIKLPGYTRPRYFSLIVREEKEEDPLLSEFTSRLSSLAETCRLMQA
ncbi:MAG TPA: hypothetical protein VD772_10920 [Anseongella sp.]|nr:hypothetical protein [Anseongella sp.]